MDVSINIGMNPQLFMILNRVDSLIIPLFLESHDLY
jgi:hypothetical protein